MNGTLNILWYYLKTKYLQQFRSRADLLIWQDKKVRSFLSQILPKSQFYQNYYQGLDIRDWQQFPIIDKSVMMANFNWLNTVNIKKSEAFAVALETEKMRKFSSSTLHNFTIGLSSGTSGNRGLFIVSKQEQQAWAGMILAKALHQSIFTKQRLAFFLRANSKLYETVKSQLQFEYFDLCSSIESNIKRLEQYSPTILVAPPSMLLLLAEAQIMGDLNITPSKIIAVAEVFEPLDRIFISRTFNQIIHQVYQCTEGFLASTCDYGTLHLNEDIVAIQKEYLDRDNCKFMPIITDFNRTTQPIIRYRLDDILTERKTPCPCGSILTAIESIEGRRDDIFYLPHKTQATLVPLFPDFVRRAIISASEEIQEYIAVQKRLDLIEISLKVPTSLSVQVQTMVQESLLALFERSYCQVPEIRYQEYNRTQHERKLRRIYREFSPDVKSSRTF